MSAVVDAVTERRLGENMIDQKCSDLDSGIFVNNTLFDVFGYNDCSLCWHFLVYIAADVYVELVGLLKVRHHFPGSLRPPNSKRDGSSAQPTGQPKIGNSNDV